MGTAKELPAEPVGVTVLSLGDAPVWRGRAHEAPTDAELAMGRFENGEIDQAFELGTAASGLSVIGWRGHVGSAVDAIGALPLEGTLRLGHDNSGLSSTRSSVQAFAGAWAPGTQQFRVLRL